MKNTLLLLVFVLVGGCASMDIGKFGPYNISADGEDKRLMLNGFDPVSYHTEQGLVRGKADIKTEFDGVTYRFSSDANRALFQKTPERFVPQFGGFCANGIVYGIPWGGDGDQWKLIDGKLTVFGGQTSRNYFLMVEKPNLKLAQQYWNDEIKGNSALWQRYKRLLFRVPHYKTGAELEAEWQKTRLANPSPARAQ
jgi:YHS domain-containing protein